MFAAFLFACWFLFFLLVIMGIAKKAVPGLKSPVVAAIFGFKVLSGCIYGYIFLKYYGGDDPWMYFRASTDEYQKLVHQPGVFFNDLLPGASFSVAHGFWQGISYYRQDLEFWLMVKMLAVFNIFSRGNYYIDTIFFDFLTLTGLLLLYKLLVSYFPAKKTGLLIVLFFIPPITFWLSGIRAEGLLILFIGMILYNTDRWLDRKKFINFLYAATGLVGMFIFREQSLLLLAPAFFCWTISWKNKPRSLRNFFVVYSIGLLIFWGSILISGENNLASPLVKSQQEFFNLHGNTRFALDTLQPNIGSVIKILPQAFSNVLLRPFIWEAKGVLQIISSLEIIGCWVLLILLFFYRDKEWRSFITHPLLLLFVFYSVTQALIIGYIVPFPGAIVRYKAIPEMLLLVVMVVLIEYRKTNNIKY